MLLVRLVLAVGWLLHLSAWLLALRHSGRDAAARAEWVRELTLRVAMLLLIVAALAVPSGGWWDTAKWSRVTLLLAFSLGQALAIVARSALSHAWGIGVQPRGAVVRAGPYALLPHPIYAGTALAIFAQLLLLQNLPALVLAVGAGVVIALKIRVERRLLGGRRA
ncbi:MAG: hypothetical protein FIB01_08855 [Gemmatimonadetes bacterium]|nr:hypothetical protein [Gemmatimonadota bacterium]